MVFRSNATKILLFVLLAPFSGAQTITEIIDATGDGAGNPLEGSDGIAVDGAGNVYVVGGDSHNAFKITPEGLITEIIDATGDRAGNPLSRPIGIAVDGSGNVYVTGLGSNNAFKITPGGLITEIINTTGDGAGHSLFNAVGPAVDKTGNVYVAGQTSDNAFKITPEGLITQIIDATGDGAGNPLDTPFGITVDGAANVYVPGVSSFNAFKITPEGLITQIIDATGDGAGNPLTAPIGIAVSGAENVYLSGLGSSNAFKITPEGLVTEIIDATGDGAGNLLSGAFGISVDRFENVYLAAQSSDNAFKITPGGLITEIINPTGDGAGNPLDNPRYIAVDGAGSAYVTGIFSDNAFKTETCTQPPTGLVSWWPGDGSVQDIVGMSDGLLIGDATFGLGLVGQAFSLDGDHDWVDFGTDPIHNFGTHDFTVMLWMNLNTLTGIQVLFEKWDNGPSFKGNEHAGWSLAKLGSNTLEFAMGQGGSSHVRLQGFPTGITAGIWGHVAVTRESGTVRIYWRGDVIASASVPFLQDTPFPLLLGRRYDSRGFFTNGSFDDVQIYDRALTEAEIQEIVSTGNIGMCRQETIFIDGFESGDTSNWSSAIPHNLATCDH